MRKRSENERTYGSDDEEGHKSQQDVIDGIHDVCLLTESQDYETAIACAVIGSPQRLTLWCCEEQ